MGLGSLYCLVLLGNPSWAFVTSLFALAIFLAERSPMQKWMMVASTLSAILHILGTWNVTFHFGALVSWMVNQAAKMEVVPPADLQSLLQLHRFEGVTNGYRMACLLADYAKVLLLPWVSTRADRRQGIRVCHLLVSLVGSSLLVC
jgi:hypothetical protein